MTPRSPRHRLAPGSTPTIAVLGLGIAVGLIAGTGAWLFRALIAVVHDLLFEQRLGAVYNANLHTPTGVWGPLVILVPVVGGLGVVAIVEHFAPEARGHGVPEVLDAVYYEDGRIRPRVAVFKALASALSIGSGGSVGREGPIAQIGAAFGSTLGSALPLSADERRLLIAAGAGAGIAATFDAPFGGLLFSVELLLVVITPETLAVTAAAVISAVFVARGLIGSGLAFTVPDLQQVDIGGVTWAEMVVVVGLGAALGAVSAGVIRSLAGAERWLEEHIVNGYLRHALAMLIVGTMMFGFARWQGTFAIQGVGYATILDILRDAITNPLLLLTIGLAKWVAMVLTLGSGASGGVFSPSLFIGASFGAAVGQVAVHLGIAVDPVLLALVGMAAMVAGTTGAVLTSIAMLAEMTGDYGAVVPLLAAATLAAVVRRTLSIESIYTEKIVARGHPVPQGLEAMAVGLVRRH